MRWSANTVRCLGAVLVALLAAVSSARAETPFDKLLDSLRPSGRVNDFAGILSADERQVLQQVAADLEAKTTAEMAIVTLKSLQGGNVDDFANKLFAKWGIGKKGRNNGILILVAMEDRAGRIEVGYGLEAVLPDAMAGRVLDQTLFPAFREAKYGQGLIAAAKRVAGIVEGDKDAVAASRGEGPPVLVTVMFIGVFVAIGAYLLGAGMGAKVPATAVFGGLFAGFALAVDTFFAMTGGGMLNLLVHVPLAVLLIVVGFRYGRKNPGGFRNTGSGSGGGWSSGGWSSGGGSSSSGSFGGGSSGGGGASGRW